MGCALLAPGVAIQQPEGPEQQKGIPKGRQRPLEEQPCSRHSFPREVVEESQKLVTVPLLPPQIDGSTLRTLCLQHGPLITFHLNLTQGNAVVRYSSKEEAAKAQKSLHMYVPPARTPVSTQAQALAVPWFWRPEVGSRHRQGCSLPGCSPCPHRVAWGACVRTTSSEEDTAVAG